MTATWNGRPSSSNVLRAISAGKCVPSTRRPVDLRSVDLALAGHGQHLVLVERDQVPESDADQSVHLTAEQLARLSGRPGHAALLVEGQDRVRVGLEQCPEARLVGANHP